MGHTSPTSIFRPQTLDSYYYVRFTESGLDFIISFADIPIKPPRKTNHSKSPLILHSLPRILPQKNVQKLRTSPCPIPVPYPERTSSSAGEVHGFSIGQAFADVLLKCLYRLAAMKRNGGFLDQNGGKSWRMTWARKQWDLLIWYIYIWYIYIYTYTYIYIYMADLCWS